MQKRDKFGKFLKKSVTKNHAKKMRNKAKIQVKKANSKEVGYKLVKQLSLYDLHEMISAEVAYQLGTC